MNSLLVILLFQVEKYCSSPLARATWGLHLKPFIANHTKWCNFHGLKTVKNQFQDQDIKCNNRIDISFKRLLSFVPPNTTTLKSAVKRWRAQEDLCVSSVGSNNGNISLINDFKLRELLWNSNDFFRFYLFGKNHSWIS